MFNNSTELNRHTNNIGVFGGTFNPVHLGHIYLAKYVRQEYSLNKIVFLPTGNPPHKTDILDKEHRFAMLELAIKGCNYLIPSRLESNRQGITYTVDTLNLLQQQIKNGKIFYIIGSDTLFELYTWRDIDKIFELCEFICVIRGEDDLGEIGQTINTYYRATQKTIHLSTAIVPNISSADIRQRIKNNKSTEGMLDPLVEEYIKINGIYVS